MSSCFKPLTGRRIYIEALSCHILISVAFPVEALRIQTMRKAGESRMFSLNNRLYIAVKLFLSVEQVSNVGLVIDLGLSQDVDR